MAVNVCVCNVQVVDELTSLLDHPEGRKDRALSVAGAEEVWTLFLRTWDKQGHI